MIRQLMAPCSKDGALIVAAPSRTSQRRSNTPSSDVCVHCRRSKLGCEPDKPCRRCVQRGCADTCVSWRETQMASGGEQGAAGSARRQKDCEVARVRAGGKRRRRMDEGKEKAMRESKMDDSTDDARSESEASSYSSPVSPASTLMGAGLDDQNGFVERDPDEWSDDEDDFSRGLKYLKTLPLPEDFRVLWKIA